MLAAIACSLLLAPSQAPIDLAPLETKLEAICAPFEGRIGYALILPTTGQAISRNGDDLFPTASTIKTAVMVHAINLVDEGKMTWKDKRVVPPMEGRQASMWSYSFKDGIELDLDGWTNLMITVSDNTATMVLREWLGIDAINDRMESLGLPNTKVLGNVEDKESEVYKLRQVWGLGVTTPNEMARLFEMIYKGEAASAAGCDKMVRILGNQYWDDWIGGSVPPHYQVASKSGAISRSRSDSAIVYGPTPYILTIYTDEQKDQRWEVDNAGDLALVAISRAVWAHLNPGEPYSPPEGFEKFVPTGGGV